MRRPKLTPPRLLTAAAIAAAVGLALALPGLLDADSASETSAVIIGEHRQPQEPRAGRTEPRRDAAKSTKARAGDRRATRGRDAPVGSTARGGRPAPPSGSGSGSVSVSDSPSVGSNPGRTPAGGGGGGGGGGSDGGSAPAAPVAPPPAVAPVPDDDVEDDVVDDDVSDRGTEG